MAQVTINLTDRLLTSTYQAQRSIFGNYTQVTNPTTVTSAAQAITVPPASLINWVKINFTRNSPAHGIALHQIIVDGEVAHAVGMITSGAQLSKALFNPGNHTIAVRFKSKTAGTNYGYGTWQTNSSQLNQTSAYLTIDYEGPDAGGGNAPSGAVKSGLALGSSGVKCGNGILFLIQNQSPGVYHAARVGISGVTLIDEIVPRGATSYLFEVPYGWQQYIAPTASARYAADGVYARLFTYTDPARTQLIGYSDAPMYIAVSDDNVPVIHELTETRVPSYEDEGLDFYVQGLARAQLSGLADGQFGTSITEYRFFSGAWSQTVKAEDLTDDELPEVLSPVLTQSGSVSFGLEVTDTRRRKATEVVEIAVTPYRQPELIDPGAYRSDEAGAPATSGTYMRIISGMTVSSLNGLNTSTLKARVWLKGTTAPGWETAQALTPGTALILPDISIDTAYSVEIRVTDRLSGSAFYAEVSTAKALLSGLPGVTGAAVGKHADRVGAFDIAFPVALVSGDPVPTLQIGDILTTTNPTHPNLRWPGTQWEPFAQGRSLVGYDENDVEYNIVEATFGNKLVSAAINGIAKIGFSGTAMWIKRKAYTWRADGKGTISGGVVSNTDNLTSGIELDATASVDTRSPSIVIYYWKRIG